DPYPARDRDVHGSLASRGEGDVANELRPDALLPDVHVEGTRGQVGEGAEALPVRLTRDRVPTLPPVEVPVRVVAEPAAVARAHRRDVGPGDRRPVGTHDPYVEPSRHPEGQRHVDPALLAPKFDGLARR